MIPKIMALANTIARDPITVDELIHEIGRVLQDYGPNVLLAPQDPAFTSADIVRRIDPDTHKPVNIPAFVELTPLEPPSLKDLSKAFGPFTRIPAEEKQPPQAIFYLDIHDRPYDVALIAEIKKNHATKIILRRDIHL